MPDNPAILLGIIAAAVLSYMFFSLLKTRSFKETAGFFFGRYRPRTEVAGISLRPGEAAMLRYTVKGEKTARLFLRYDVEYRWDSGVYSDDETAYGVVIAGEVAAPGKGVQDITMGFGALIARNVASFTGISYYARYSRTVDTCRYRVTVPLCIIRDCRPGSEVSAALSVSQSPNIIMSDYRLFLTK